MNLSERLGAYASAVLLLWCGGCAHVVSVTTTFQRTGPVLVLRLERHLDTVLRGPDIDEDQILVLELTDPKKGQRFVIPSALVKARFDAERFAPPSKGREFRGSLVVRKITPEEVVAKLDLKVVATTADRSYVQTAKFDGEYRFVLVSESR